MEELNPKTFLCFGFSMWKRNHVRRYLDTDRKYIRFLRSAPSPDGVGENTVLLTWGLRQPEGLAELAASKEVQIHHMEDGFLRSVGLGSDITAPASLVIDTRGIYYDPSGPSDLEYILENEKFSEEELGRAAKLREMIVSMDISKYNLDGGERLETPKGSGQKVVLVPGQVEDDASIELGTVDVRTNLDLLREARKAEPEAFIIFKPHPDVVSGNRLGQVPDNEASRLADSVLEDSSISHCLDVADAVHTMTSLVGFEGLLRGLEVTVHGRPFYAGWGLTKDRHRTERRSRRLNINELVAGTLIRYPMYMDPDTLAFTTPENIVLKLQRLKEAAGDSRKVKAWRPTRQLKRFFQVIRSLIDAR